MSIVNDAIPAVGPDPAEEAVTALLTALGVDLGEESLADTPRRVAAAYRELLEPHEFTATTFPNEDGCDELVLVRSIPFQSLCCHHLLPFFGVAHVGYVPGKRVLGLSKLARVVQASARGLQIQERITTRIADWLTEELDPLGAGAVVEAQHTCMSVRGVKAVGAWTTTSAVRGVLREDPHRREEFMRRTESGGGVGWR
ncbi:GTP cyclohydrolase I FolE (plasmid) [Streptomyces californicus]|uniref:GTP cyclohydrolase 1 n=1 Tax=Streptomyces californicus TaxID=67351 RepID=A0ABX7JGH7_9ACTN|nr:MULTISPECIES: GTP cyclohydrolase I FolE [Streptomyces]QRV32490.1 GTP cyclohydrolase I FolE [Streptomyces californicus]QRV45905.1 GTP cyclohydrolase I FolE [Streptomyces californicus]